MTIPLLMGILNVTPDSFSDGGSFYSLKDAVAHGIQLMDDGADIIDIGGESTRPNADIIPPHEEQLRVLPVIAALKPTAQKRGIKISIDTRNASTMREAVKAGAELINDVSALTHDADSLKTAASTNAQIILMHMQGTPQTMQNNPNYKNVVADVYDYLQKRITACVAAGIAKSRLIVDPGLGFGKTVEHNIALLTHAREFQKLGVPVLIGASRKSFLGKLNSHNKQSIRHAREGGYPRTDFAGKGQISTKSINDNNTTSKLVDTRLRGHDGMNNLLPASLAAAIIAAQQGAQILRVHDVAETKQALMIWQAFAHIDNSP